MEDDALPPAPSLPEDPDVVQKIELLANFVLKNGVEFEDLARQKEAKNEKFAFLFGRDPVALEYYEWKKRALQAQQQSPAVSDIEMEVAEPASKGDLSVENGSTRGDIKKDTHRRSRFDRGDKVPNASEKPSDTNGMSNIHTHNNGVSSETAKRKSFNDSRRESDGRQQGLDEFGRVARYRTHDSDSDNERHPSRRNKQPSQSRTPEPRKRNRSRSRSPHRSNIRSPRRHRSRSRSRSPGRELRRGGEARGDPRANAARNRQVCNDFLKGRCSRGTNCRYIHEENEGRSSSKWSKDGRDREDWDKRGSRDRGWSAGKGDGDHEGQGQQEQLHSVDVDKRDVGPSQGQQADWANASTSQYSNQWHAGSEFPREPEFDRNLPSSSQNGSQPWMAAGPREQSLPMQQMQQSSQTPDMQYPVLQSYGVPYDDFEPAPPGAGDSLQKQIPENSIPPQHMARMSSPEELVMEAVSPDMPGRSNQQYASANAEQYLQQSQQQYTNTQQSQQQYTNTNPEHYIQQNAPPAPPEAEKGSPDHAEATGSDENPEGEDAEGNQDHKGKKDKDSKATMLVRIAVTEYVKEALKPTWKEGHMSKEVYKTIAKKAVDRVVGSLQSHQIPRTPEKVDHFMALSRQKISKLVQGYVEKYVKSSES